LPSEWRAWTLVAIAIGVVWSAFLLVLLIAMVWPS
jgi:hypothetical protein